MLNESDIDTMAKAGYLNSRLRILAKFGPNFPPLTWESLAPDQRDGIRSDIRAAVEAIGIRVGTEKA